MSRVRRPGRRAAVLWVVVAVIVWNGLYDLRISLGVREYLLAEALHQAGRGPAVVMADFMASVVRSAVITATLWGTFVLVAGLGTVWALSGRPASPGR
jgi:thiol:disulfide interchange protein